MSPNPFGLLGASVGGYRLEHVLQQGSASVLYDARDRDGVELAVEVANEGLIERTPERVERAKAMHRALAHPNVLRLRDAGTFWGRAYFISERYDGSLIERIAASGALPPRDAGRLARDLLSGLAAIHALGFVHGAIAAEHVLHGRDGRWMLGGIGRGDTNVRTDLRSLGVVVWHAIVGKAPHEETADPVKPTGLDPAVPDLAEHASATPEPLLHLVRRLVHKDPAERPASARAALEELDARSFQATAPQAHDAPTRRGPPVRASDLTVTVPVDPKATRPAPPTRTRLARANLEAGPAVEIRADVAARFEEHGVLGRGGMGTVLRVLDKNLEREVAMKVAAPELEGTARVAESFVREARVLAQLEHPNVVPVHELAADAAGRVFFVMRLVDGVTLEERIEKADLERPFEERLHELLLLFLKVCDGVAFAHSKGVLHCDLKPQNVMTGRFGEAYVVDWGLARKKHAPPRLAPDGRTAASGTPAFMAPEQARAEDHAIDERTDVFGLGGILFSILTGGGAPFDSGDAIASLVLARDEPAPDPQKLSPVPLPPPLVAIALKALAREPGDRYATAQDMRAAVEEYLRGGLSARVRTFSAGAAIVKEGESGESAFIITRGRCRAWKTGPAGERVVLREMGPGDVFGELGAILGRPRTATVEAVTEVTAQVVARDELARGLAYHPWLDRILRSLAERFRELDARANPGA